jgi:hypothetical protein
MIVGVMPPAQVVKPPLEVGQVQIEPGLDIEDLEVFHMRRDEGRG